MNLAKRAASSIVNPSFFTLFELTRQCPECLRWGSLELVETRHDTTSDELRIFRCTSCNKETVINHNLPPRAV